MNLQDALALYNRLGFGVVPLVPRDKRPVIDWMAYQKRVATPEEHALWWPGGASPQRNIGVVTGEISNLLVLDLDDVASYEAVLTVLPWLAETMTVETGKGFHAYVRPEVPAGATFTFLLDGVLNHVKSDGGYVVAPPSIHPSGRVYTLADESAELMTVHPKVLVAGLTELGAKMVRPEDRGESQHPPSWIVELLESDCPSGGRNDTLSRLVGWFRNAIVYRKDVTLAIAQLWNEQHCKPPLPYREVESVVNSIYSRTEPPGWALGYRGDED